MRILLVCSGNTCRSPMAEALMRREAAQRGMTALEFSSAGISVWPGSRASRHAVASMASRELDIDRRIAVQVTPQLLSEADLVLTMTQSQADALREELPRFAAKVHTLGEYSGQPGDVDDPYGRDAEVYENTAKQLERLVALALDKLQKA